MAKFSKDCIKAALDKMPDFSEEEITEYLSEVFARSREYNELGSMASIYKAIKEIHNEKLEGLLEDVTITANNAKKFQKMSSMIEQKKATVDELAIRARSDRNKDFNIESSQRSKMNEYHKLFHDELTPEETLFLTDEKNSVDIGRAIDGKEASAEAKKIAELHLKLVDKVQSDIVSSNAMPIYALNKDRQINAVHDRKKILHPNQNPFKILSSGKKYDTTDAKKAWISTIKQHLNIIQTYKKIGAISKDGTVDMAAIDKHLSNTFDNIINGYSEIFTRSRVQNDLDAIKKRKRMFFVWKDTESWLKYNEVYGTGNYYSALRSFITSSSNKVGASQLFGDNPRNMFMNLMKQQMEFNPKTAGWVNRTETNFKYITGIDKASVNPSVEAFGSNLRSILSMARLGNIGISSIGDVVKGASHVSKFGFGFYGPLLNNMKNIFNNPVFTTEERKRIASIFKLNLDSHMGYLGKFMDANTVGDSVSKFTNAFYRKMLMTASDNGNKISVMHMMAKGLADQSSKGWGAISNDLKKQLSKYGINEKEWDVLRQNNQDGLFTIDNVSTLSDDMLKKLQVGEDTKTSLYELRNNLMRKVYTLFDVANATAIGQPDTYMKAFLEFGSNAGTASGQMIRALTQFKGFALQHIDRMYLNNFKDIDGVKAKTIFFFNMFAASFGINLLSNMLGYFAQGKSMPNLSLMSAPEKAKFVMENMDANIGLLYKGLSNSYPGKMKSMVLMSSPTTEFLGNIIDTMTNSTMSLTGDTASWKRAGKSARAAAKGILPTTTIPFLSPFLNELMGDKTYLQPGQEQIYGK